MRTTPKDFFVWVGAMIALYVSVFSLVSLLFQYIDYSFPDALTYIEPYSSGMRSDMASLIILFPLFLLLMHLIRADIRRIPEKRDLWVRRWAVMFTIFVAGATVAVELTRLVNNFLGGELTIPFLLKTAIILLIAIGGLLHFIADIRGYWDTHAPQLRAVVISTVVLVLATLAAGFIIMGSPAQVRLYRFDDQKVSDLQEMQWQVQNYLDQKGSMPQTTSDLNDPMLGYIVPTDPQTNAPYEYQKTGDLSFKLCATFNAETWGDGANKALSVPVGPYGPISTANQNWYHTAGHVCFNRVATQQKTGK